MSGTEINAIKSKTIAAVVGNVINMGNMFGDAISFNQDLSEWDVGQVTDMVKMFRGATSFNQVNLFSLDPHPIAQPIAPLWYINYVPSALDIK